MRRTMQSAIAFLSLGLLCAGAAADGVRRAPVATPAGLTETNPGEWTWAWGSSIVPETPLYGVYGTKGAPDPANRPGARTGSATWTAADGTFWLFGGSGYSATGYGYLNDLWRWDGTAWAWMGGSSVEGDPGSYGTKGVTAPENLPSARSQAAAGVDAAGTVWLFGGWRFTDTGGSLNDLWKWDGTNWTWVNGSSGYYDLGTRGTLGVPDPANVPSSRRGAAAWIDPSGRFWVHGGYGAADRRDLDDLWRWDGTTWTWMALDCYYPTFLALRDAATWTDRSGNLWLYGGFRAEALSSEQSAGRLSDLWRWSGAIWTHVAGPLTASEAAVHGTKGVPDPANTPGARWHSMSWADSAGNFWLFGGEGTTGAGVGSMNDLWRWDGAAWTWMGGAETPGAAGVYGSLGVPAPGNAPGARRQAASWTSPDGAFWLGGGWGRDSVGAEGGLGDLWAYEPEACATAAGAIESPGSVLAGAAASASVADAGPSATYSWRVEGGTIDTGQGTPAITFTAAAEATKVLLGLTIRVGTCTANLGRTVLVGAFHRLDVVRNGNAADVVMSADRNLFCGAGCSELFAAGSVATLVSVPAAGSRFAGWLGGGCSGTGNCTVTMDGPKTVSATFFPSAPAGFHPVAPCRVVDTRNAAGPWGAPALAAGTTRAFEMAGRCGVPSDASAVALNVTVTAPTEAGSLTLLPGSGPAPETTTIHFAAGRTRANNATMGLAGGALSVLDRQEAGTVELILDVSGYYR